MAGAKNTCAEGTASYAVAWAATDATAVSGAIGTIPAQTFTGKEEGSFAFCAPPRTGVALTVTGPGGRVSTRTTTP